MLLLLVGAFVGIVGAGAACSRCSRGAWWAFFLNVVYWSNSFLCGVGGVLCPKALAIPDDNVFFSIVSSGFEIVS